MKTLILLLAVMMIIIAIMIWINRYTATVQPDYRIIHKLYEKEDKKLSVTPPPPPSVPPSIPSSPPVPPPVSLPPPTVISLQPSYPYHEPSTTKVYKGEEICRRVLETHFKKEFPRVRPDWLMNPETGRNLELDCFNEELRIACEHNGKQHYQYPNFTGQTLQAFMQQVRRDQFKKEVCALNNIDLIIVPPMNYKDIPSYLLRKIHQILHTRQQNVKPS